MSTWSSQMKFLAWSTRVENGPFLQSTGTENPSAFVHRWRIAAKPIWSTDRKHARQRLPSRFRSSRSLKLPAGPSPLPLERLRQQGGFFEAKRPLRARGGEHQCHSYSGISSIFTSLHVPLPLLPLSRHNISLDPSRLRRQTSFFLIFKFHSLPTSRSNCNDCDSVTLALWLDPLTPRDTRPRPGVRIPTFAPSLIHSHHGRGTLRNDTIEADGRRRKQPAHKCMCRLPSRDLQRCCG